MAIRENKHVSLSIALLVSLDSALLIRSLRRLSFHPYFTLFFLCSSLPDCERLFFAHYQHGNSVYKLTHWRISGRSAHHREFLNERHLSLTGRQIFWNLKSFGHWIWILYMALRSYFLWNWNSDKRKDLIHDTRNLCPRFRIEEIKVMSPGILGDK